MTTTRRPTSEIANEIVDKGVNQSMSCLTLMEMIQAALDAEREQTAVGDEEIEKAVLDANVFGTGYLRVTHVPVGTVFESAAPNAQAQFPSEDEWREWYSSRSSQMKNMDAAAELTYLWLKEKVGK